MSQPIIKTPEQIDGIRKASRVAARILNQLGESIYIGMNTQEIDNLAVKLIQEAGGIAATLGYGGFTKSLCTSVNEVICHGIPGNDILKDGDIINIDITVILDGYYGDTSKMFFVGNISKEAQALIDATKKCLNRGIEQVYPGNHLSNIGYSIQKYAEKKGYSVVKDYCGHGIGLEFHEEPQVLHYGRKNRGIQLKAGMIFTIEPMINAGSWESILDKGDGWTVRTKDNSLSAQFEHTILVTETGYEILTTTALETSFEK